LSWSEVHCFPVVPQQSLVSTHTHTHTPQETSELIHIDLGVAFDQGQLLCIPEKVPFRLTRDLVDALGQYAVCISKYLKL
jgi:hypothetical protein